jgi:DNA-3-methyladenine glycosylase I
MNATLKRCWTTEKPLYIRYHDEEWGVPLHDDKKLFEFMILDGFQAGLSWWLILERRNTLRKAFDNFDPEKVAKYSPDDVSRIMNAPGVIRNKAKISSAVNNARHFLTIQAEFGTFDVFMKFNSPGVLSLCMHRTLHVIKGFLSRFLDKAC